jgi:hypothetical protein
MSDEIPGLDAMAIIRRYVDGADDALGELIACYRARFLRTANGLLRKLGIDPASLDGDGAVDLAFNELFRIRDDPCLASIKDSEDLLKLMTVVLRGIVKDEKKHSDAIRRGGAGRKAREDRAPGQGKARGGNNTRPVGAYHRTEMDLDQLISDQPPVEDTVLINMELEEFLEKLGDVGLRAIFRLLRDEYSIREIAGLLRVSVTTVRRKQARIQSIYWELNPERKGKLKGKPGPT